MEAQAAPMLAAEEAPTGRLLLASFLPRARDPHATCVQKRARVWLHCYARPGPLACHTACSSRRPGVRPPDTPAALGRATVQ
eukprot:6102547-Prymnesium_polylepis.4